MMKRLIFFGLIFILFILPIGACAANNQDPVSEQLSSLYAEDDLGYDLAFFQRTGSTMRRWNYCLVDFDRECFTEISVSARRGDTSGYRKVGSIRSRKMFGTLEDGWRIEYSNGIFIVFSVVEIDNVQYVEEKRDDKVLDRYQIVDVSEGVDLLKNGLTLLSDKEKLKRLTPEE